MLLLKNSDIVDASFALVDSPQWNFIIVFQGGLRLISWIKLEYCPIRIHCGIFLALSFTTRCQNCRDFVWLDLGLFTKNRILKHISFFPRAFCADMMDINSLASRHVPKHVLNRMAHTVLRVQKELALNWIQHQWSYC